MTYARRDIVEPDEVSIYHCISRCVRRAFLCGEDSVAGRSFEHRRCWIRSRLAELTEVFGVEVVAYAVMSNHLHSVLRIRPDIVATWSPEEVARRWRQLFPRRRVRGIAVSATDDEIEAIVSQPGKVRLYRERLCSISWFNRCLNENIARRANVEDECSGRFWEGRFKCQRIYDVAGVIACAVYVELNPIRAGSAKTLEGSDHTSIQDRIHIMRGRRPKRCRTWTRISLVPISEISEQALTATEYLELVDTTGRQLVEGKGSISPEISPILDRLGLEATQWLDIANNLGRKFQRIVGPVESLEAAARRAKKCWFTGKTSARAIFHASVMTTNTN